MNAAFVARMEDVLDIYERPHNPQHPVVCFDERPCFLCGDVVGGLAPQPGKPAKEHYACSKHGSCCALAAVEPLTGQRLSQVRSQRTKRGHTQFMQQLAARCPQATKIRLVQDNLNTHALSTFCDCLPAAMAQRLAERFEVYYTPKCGSWLNQLERDFSALSRQCLKRRMPTQAPLAYQVCCWRRERQAQGVKICWQFTVAQARQTLNSQYCKVKQVNQIYQKTS